MPANDTTFTPPGVDEIEVPFVPPAPTDFDIPGPDEFEVAPIGKLPASRFGADIQPPEDATARTLGTESFVPKEKFARNPLQATPPENPESLQPIVKANEAKDFLTSPPQPTVAEQQIQAKPLPIGSEPFSPQEAATANEAAGKHLATLTTPFVELGKTFGVTPQEITDATDTVQGIGAALNAAAQGRDPDKAFLDVAGQQSRKPGATEEISAGVHRAVLDSLDFFTSPLGIATLGQGYLPRLAQRAVSLAFVADMARHAPEQLQQFLEAKYADDKEGMARALVGMGLTGAFVLGGALHGVEGVPRDVAEHFSPSRRVARLIDEAVRKQSTRRSAPTELRETGAPIAPADFIRTDFTKPTPESASTEQGAGEPLDEKPITKETPAAPVTPKLKPLGAIGMGKQLYFEVVEPFAAPDGRTYQPGDKVSDGQLKQWKMEVPKEAPEPTPVREPDESEMDYGAGGEMPKKPAVWEQPQPKQTFEEYLAKQRGRIKLEDRERALELWRAGDSGAVELISNERPNRKLIVSKEPTQIGKWRVTAIDEHGPSGHNVFNSREAALRAALGESHSDMVSGPSYHSREYKVSRVRPEKSELNYGAGGEMPSKPGVSFPVPENEVSRGFKSALRKSVAAWKRAEKRLRRAQRQDPSDVHAAQTARDDAEVNFRALAKKAKISREEHDRMVAEAKATETTRPPNPAKLKAANKPFNLLNEMKSDFGKIALKSSRKGMNPKTAEAEFYASEDYRHLARQHGTYFAHDGQTIDNAYQWALNKGHIPPDAKFDDFRQALMKASADLAAYHKARSDERITNAFQQHVRVANNRVSRHVIVEKAVSELGLGDKFKLGGVTFEVTHVENAEQPWVQVKSDKFGVQNLPEGETLKVDKGTFRKNKYKPATDEEGNTLFRTRKVKADQFELPGQEDAFNLAGEKIPETKPPPVETKPTESETEGQGQLFRTKPADRIDDIFDRAAAGDEAAFDELHQRLHGAETEADRLERFGRGDPNTVPNAAAFERLFEDAFAKKDFDRILNAIKATSDVTVWKPLLQKFFKAQKTDPLAAQKAEWMRAVFNGTRPPGALPPKAPKPPPAQPPPRPPTGGPRPGGARPGGTGGTGGTGGGAPPPRTPPAPPPQRIEAAGIPGGTPKSPYQILKDFSKAIGKALEVRRQKPNVLGYYAPGSTLTTLRFAGDLDTAAHELAGHWTDDRYGIGKPWVNSRQPSPYDAELQKFWIHGSYRPGMSRRMMRAEGIAEYIRAYVVNPDAARAAAPNFTGYFESSIPARALNAIKAFSNDVRTWVGADPILRSSMEFRRNPPSVTERLWNVLRGEGHGFVVGPLDRLRQWFDDSLHYAMKADAQAKAIHKRDLTPENDFSILARLLPSHDARMEDQFEHGLVEFRTRQIRDAQGNLSVSRPLDPVTGRAMSLHWLLDGFNRSNREAFLRDMDATSAFMVHQRTLEKARQLGRPENISGMGAGMMSDTQAAREFMRALDRDPAFKARLTENARRYRLWADHNLQMLVDAGRLSADAYRNIKRNNIQYVAMQRLSDEFNVAHGGRSSNAVGTAKQPIHRFKGSSLQIGNVYENLLEQTNLVQKESFRNAAMRAFVDGLTNTRGLHGRDRMDLSQFGSRATSRDPNTIKVYQDGRVQYWKFNHDIHESLKGLGELGTHAFINILAMPSTFARYMITHGPQFLLRNPVRDTFERSVVSNNGSKPWDILKGYTQDELSRYNVFGGGQFGNYIVDKHVWNKELARVSRELVKDPRNIIYSPLKLKHAWEQLAHNSESVGRVAEFRRAFEKGKERGYDDYNAALYAASEARGLLDFAKAGTIMRVINRLVPFSNARVRGLARSAFQIGQHPGRFAMNWGLYVLAPVLATWMWNRKDHATWEEYQQLPAYQKDFFWNFKIGHHWLSIPRPHELGVMAGGVERALNRILGDKKAMEGYGMSTLSAAAPVSDPVELTGPLRTWLELEFNRDTFRNRDIIPSWERDLSLQVREEKGMTKSASAAGKGLAAILNTTGMGADPRQVDYFLNSLGGLGQIATTATSPTRTPSEILTKSTGYVRDVPGSGARDVQWVLDWAKKNGYTQHKVVENLKLLRQDVINEKSPEVRDKKSVALRHYAEKLRTSLEKFEESKAKAKKP